MTEMGCGIFHCNNGTLTGTTPSGQSSPGSNDNEWVLLIPQNSRTGGSPSDDLDPTHNEFPGYVNILDTCWEWDLTQMHWCSRRILQLHPTGYCTVSLTTISNSCKYIIEQTGLFSLGKQTSVGEGKTLNSKPEECCSGESVAYWFISLPHLHPNRFQIDR